MRLVIYFSLERKHELSDSWVLAVCSRLLRAEYILLTASPNEARDTSVAILYLLVILFGRAIGPTSIVLLNDYAFQDRVAIDWPIFFVAMFR